MSIDVSVLDAVPGVVGVVNELEVKELDVKELVWLRLALYSPN